MNWIALRQAFASPGVAAVGKLAIGAACIEEEAPMRAMLLIHGRDRAPAQCVAHGGRFRFGDDGQLMIQVPGPPFALHRVG